MPEHEWLFRYSPRGMKLVTGDGFEVDNATITVERERERDERTKVSKDFLETIDRATLAYTVSLRDSQMGITGDGVVIYIRDYNSIAHGTCKKIAQIAVPKTQL